MIANLDNDSHEILINNKLINNKLNNNKFKKILKDIISGEYNFTIIILIGIIFTFLIIFIFYKFNRLF